MVSAQPTTKTERLGITMLINDKSQLKQNVKQIGFQLALKTSKSLSRSDRLRQTAPYCWTGNREGSVSKLRPSVSVSVLASDWHTRSVIHGQSKARPVVTTNFSLVLN